MKNFVDFLSDYIEDLKKKYEEKSRYYSDTWDKYGSRGIYIHLSKKVNHIHKWLWEENTLNEELVDSMEDLVLYALNMVRLAKDELEERKKENERKVL